ncbi:cytochrome P450 [Paenibacillus albus]|uniref:Cytochrome P450 n=1 Tax=Paenibacillus albus TaxID=2495582 RepID=A0A3Q8X5Q9_9BACL|nr:cytochrome P450 [Paenibacillus albus]AZN41148.1 cytochrome P450 [Paenibacillus albus]
MSAHSHSQSSFAEKPDIASWFRRYSEPLHRNPYPFYSYLLEQEPIRFIEENGFWVISRYEDVNRILKDPTFVREHRNAMPGLYEEPPQQVVNEWKPVNDLLDNWMLLRDAPVHTRLRGLVSPAFTPRAMERLRQNIRNIAEHLADEMAEGNEAELISGFAFPLPVIVIAEMLGVPPEDRELFKGWSHTFARILEGGDQPPDFAGQAIGAAEEISVYFRDLIGEHKKAPKEDMISDLIHAKEQADALTEQELIATCVLLLVAGHETTVNLISNTMLALLDHPEQRALLLNQPKLIASTVEEGLRYEGPVQQTSRLAAADYSIGGQTIKQGQFVTVMLGAANRDPAQFQEPDRFLIERTPNRHLAFATGAHFCLGAPLARMEGEIALSVLMQKFPKMHFKDEYPNWRPNMLFRGLGTMQVQL